MIRVKDWTEFQHYKNRQPPWIRLYGKLLDDPEWFAIQGRASWVLASCWLIAREDASKEGNLPAIAKLAFRLRISPEELRSYIVQLNHWLEYDASDLLAPCLQHATPETETETETEKKEREVPREAARSNENVSCETFQPVSVESPKGLPASYAFNGDVIRLKKSDFDNWAKAYPRIDLRAELTARDAWLATAGAKDRERWFVSTAAHLRNQNAKAAKGESFKWASGIEGVY